MFLGVKHMLYMKDKAHIWPVKYMRSENKPQLKCLTMAFVPHPGVAAEPRPEVRLADVVYLRGECAYILDTPQCFSNLIWTILTSTAYLSAKWQTNSTKM